MPICSSDLQEWLDAFINHLPRPPALALPPLPGPIVKACPELIICKATTAQLHSIAGPDGLSSSRGQHTAVNNDSHPLAWKKETTPEKGSHLQTPTSTRQPHQQQQCQRHGYNHHERQPVLQHSHSFDASQSASRKPTQPPPYRHSTAQVDYETISFSQQPQVLSEEELVHQRSSALSKKWKSEMALMVSEDYDDVELTAPHTNAGCSRPASHIGVPHIPAKFKEKPLPPLPPSTPSERVPPAGSDVPHTQSHDDISDHPYEFMIANDVPGQKLTAVSNPAGPVPKVRTRSVSTPRHSTHPERHCHTNWQDRQSPPQDENKHATLERIADEVEAFMDADDALATHPGMDEETGFIYDRVTKTGRPLLQPETKQQLRSALMPYNHKQEMPPPLPAKPRPETPTPDTPTHDKRPRYARVDMSKKGTSSRDVSTPQRTEKVAATAQQSGQRTKRMVTFADDLPVRNSPNKEKGHHASKTADDVDMASWQNYSMNAGHPATHMPQQHATDSRPYNPPQQSHSTSVPTQHQAATRQPSLTSTAQNTTQHSSATQSPYPPSCTGEQLIREMHKAAVDLHSGLASQSPSQQTSVPRRRVVSTGHSTGDRRSWTPTANDRLSPLGPRSAADGASSSESNIAQSPIGQVKYQWEESLPKRKVMTRVVAKTRTVSADTAQKSRALSTVSVI